MKKKNLGAYYPALPLDIWLDIFLNQIYRWIYQHEKIDFLFKKCAFVNETMYVECKNCIF